MKSSSAVSVLFWFWIGCVLLTFGIVENPLYDHVGLLHLCEQVSLGRTLYAEVPWMYPPLGAWFQSGVMKLIPGEYLAVNLAVSLLALLYLFGSYKLARLWCSRPNAVMFAMAGFLLTFAQSCTSGVSMMAFGMITIFTVPVLWLAWACVQSQRTGQRRYAMLGGICAGLSLLAKYEAMLAAALVLLTMLWLSISITLRPSPEKKIDLRNFLYLSFIAAAVAGLGYYFAAAQAGRENVLECMTAFGSMKEHFGRNFPSVDQIAFQGIMVAICAFLFSIAKGKEVVLRGLVVASAFLFSLLVVLISFDLHPELISSSMASIRMMNHGRADLLSIAVYYCGMIARHGLPAAALLVYFLITRNNSFKLSAVVLFAAAFGLQGRAGFEYTAFGAIPLILCLAGRHIVDLKLKIPIAVVALAYGALLAAGAYAFEFRDARWNPRIVETNAGQIRVPKTEENLAFADMVEYVRGGATNIVSVPCDGLTYWTGGDSGLIWPGLMHPKLFCLPRTASLCESLHEGGLNVLVMNACRSVALTFPESWSAFSGPLYRAYSWEEAYPDLAKTITNGVKLMEWGSGKEPYFALIQLKRYGE